jgi:hypothetical protein
MSSKWSLKLAVAFLFVVAVVAAPQRAEACSGDDCGCYLIGEECRATCPGVGQPGQQECMSACNKEVILCSKCCCCQCYLCPPACGASAGAEAVPPADDVDFSLTGQSTQAPECSGSAAAHGAPGHQCGAVPESTTTSGQGAIVQPSGSGETAPAAANDER